MRTVSMAPSGVPAEALPSGPPPLSAVMSAAVPVAVSIAGAGFSWSDLPEASGGGASTVTFSFSGAASPKPSSIPPSMARMTRIRGPINSSEVGTTEPLNSASSSKPMAARGARAMRLPDVSRV